MLVEIFAKRDKHVIVDKISYKSSSGDCIHKKNNIISIRINTLLYNTLQNKLLAMHNCSDYQFCSVSDILRHILVEMEEKGFSSYQEGYPKGEYTEVNVRVTYKQKEFWKSLPIRNKRQIFEKAIVAFTKNK